MDNFLPREKRAIMIIQYYQLNADRFLFFYSACCVQNSLCSKILEGFYEYYNVKVKNSSLLTLQPVLLLNCCHEQNFFSSLGAISLSSLRLVFYENFTIRFSWPPLPNAHCMKAADDRSKHTKMIILSMRSWKLSLMDSHCGLLTYCSFFRHLSVLLNWF